MLAPVTAVVAEAASVVVVVVVVAFQKPPQPARNDADANSSDMNDIPTTWALLLIRSPCFLRWRNGW
jgi:hypothetical protein